jgi:ABC-2 type transport system ATP-binding protein
LYGNLLTNGTVTDVIAHAGLTTWTVSGPDLQEISRQLRAQNGIEQAVAFGAKLHVSGTDASQLEQAIAPFRHDPYLWQQINPGLEDVFIHLMGSSRDNFSS